MLILILASMLFHISWMTIVEETVEDRSLHLSRILMLIPGIIIILTFINQDIIEMRVTLYACAIVSYVIGAGTIYFKSKIS